MVGSMVLQFLWDKVIYYIDPVPPQGEREKKEKGKQKKKNLIFSNMLR